MRILFRVAAGPRLGFGHLMRVRALARALAVVPVVSIRGGRGARRTAVKLGCRVEDRGLRAIAPGELDVVVVDDPSPDHGGAWLRRARRTGVTAVAVQDAGRDGCAADMIVDGRLHRAGAGLSGRPAMARRKTTCPTEALALIGARFCILDPKLRQARRVRRQTRRARPVVLVALGGGAHVHQVAGPLVREITRLRPDARIRIAAGFSRGPAIRVGDARGMVRWIRPLHGLAVELAACDVAVLGGGVTLYEACALGVPAVAVAVVTAQRPAIEAFSARGAVVDGGSVGRLRQTPVRARRIARVVVRLLQDDIARTRLAAVGPTLIDGLGTQRVAARLRALVDSRAA